MNMYANQYQSYQIQNAPPEQLLILLYDGAIRFVRKAQTAIDQDNIEERNRMVNKVSAIVSELASTLDHEIGGQLADDLERLYMFMLRELTQANINSSKKKLKVVEELLVYLRSTWTQAIDMFNKQKKEGLAFTPAPEAPPLRAAAAL